MRHPLLVTAICRTPPFIISQDTMTWLQPRVSGAVPMARNAQTVTVVGTKLFLFGGHSGTVPVSPAVP